MELTDGNNEAFNKMLGPVINDVFPVNWDKVLSFRFGYERLINKNRAIRLGYLFDENPMKDETLLPVAPGILEHFVTAGYSHKFEQWEFDISTVIGVGSTERVNESDLVGGFFENSKLEVNGFLLYLGAKYHF